MTPDQLGTAEKIFIQITEGDKPFMGLFLIIMCFMIYMALKAMGYVRSLSESHKNEIVSINNNHKDQLNFMNTNMVTQRQEAYQLMMEERSRADRREDTLFINMAKNTEQLSGIATTLKEVQFNFANLEDKVTENFDFLSGEIENVKTHVTIKKTTKIEKTLD